jgi:hypothetical protein
MDAGVLHFADVTRLRENVGDEFAVFANWTRFRLHRAWRLGGEYRLQDVRHVQDDIVLQEHDYLF